MVKCDNDSDCGLQKTKQAKTSMSMREREAKINKEL